MTDRELMQQALGILELISGLEYTPLMVKPELLEAIRARLAQPEQEPVAWMEVKVEAGFEEVKVWREPVSSKSIPLYTAPPQREWQGLEIDEVEAAATLGIYKKPLIEFARAIEAKLKEKNAN